MLILAIPPRALSVAQRLSVITSQITSPFFHFSLLRFNCHKNGVRRSSFGAEEEDGGDLPVRHLPGSPRRQREYLYSDKKDNMLHSIDFFTILILKLAAA